MTQDAELPRQIKLDYREARVNARDMAMLDYANKVARERWTITREDHARLRRHGFSDADILDMTLVVANFMLANTLTDALGIEYHENLNAIFLEGEIALDEARPRGETWVGRSAPMIRALEGEDVVWFNSPPLTLEGLRGRPVLIYFWDWIYPPALEGLPYLAAWQERYGKHGLATILVLAPEFPFAKDPGAAARALDRLNISLPVVLDPRFRTWRGSNNDFWPATYLIDPGGTLRLRRHGLAGYRQVEGEIQSIVHERGPDISLPPLMDPLDPRHQPGTVLFEPTPQLYAVYEKGRMLGHPEAAEAVGCVVTFAMPPEQEEGLLYVEGCWRVRQDGLELEDGPGRMTVRYRGASVWVVLSRTGGRAEARVLLDGKAPGALAGRDISGGRVSIQEPGAYWLIKGAFGTRELTIESETPGLIVHQMTFETEAAPDTATGPLIEVQ